MDIAKEPMRKFGEEEEDEDEKSVKFAEIMKSTPEEFDDQDKVISSTRTLDYLDDANSFRLSKHTQQQVLQEAHKQNRRRMKLEGEILEKRKKAQSHLEQVAREIHFRLPEVHRCVIYPEDTGLGSTRFTGSYRDAKEVNERKPSKRVSKKGEAATRITGSSKTFPPLEGPDKLLTHDKHRPSTETLVLVKRERFISLKGMGKVKRGYHGMEFSDSDQHDYRRNLTDSNSRVSNQSHPRRESRFVKGCQMNNKIRFAAPHHIKSRLKCPTEGVPWLESRLAISASSVRFEIPMDVKEFEKMDIKTYLCKYCKISKERMSTIKNIYKRYKTSKTREMSYLDLSRAVHHILCGALSQECMDMFLRSLQMDAVGLIINLQICSAVAATAERIIYLSFVESSGKRVPPGRVVSFMELADFHCLKWKLDGVRIDAKLKKLLFSLG